MNSYPQRRESWHSGRMLIVVAAALIDPARGVLMQQRPPTSQHGGLWEFPGGKVEPGESLRAALIRELDEELGIAVTPGALTPLSFAAVPLAGDELALLLFRCTAWSGVPHALEASAIRWVDAAACVALPMPPADIPLAHAIADWMRGCS